MKRLGFFNKYYDLIMKNNIKVVCYDDITANPTLERIEDGIRIAKKAKVDFIFCLGGGSVIDSGKAISVGLFGDLWKYIEKREEKVRLSISGKYIARADQSSEGDSTAITYLTSRPSPALLRLVHQPLVKVCPGNLFEDVKAQILSGELDIIGNPEATHFSLQSETTGEWLPPQECPRAMLRT